MGVALVVLALALAARLWSRRDVAGPEEASPEEAGFAEPAPSAPSGETGAVSGTPSVEDEAPRRAVAPIARAAPTGEIDPCGDPPAITRHDRLDELVNARLSELRDRARLALSSPDTSASLRGALEAVLVRGETDLAAIEPALSAHDRAQDGFDLVSGLYLTAAVRLDRSADRAVDLAIDRASRAAPNDPAPLVLRGLRAMRMHEHRAAREALLEAFARDRDEPAIAIELAYALARTTEHRPAMEALDAYLAVYPGDPEAARLRARIERREAGVGDAASAVSVRGVTVLHARSVERTAALAAAERLATALDEAAHLLGLPRREELAVLVHRDHEAMLRAMCGQSWTAAAYDGVLHVEAELLAPSSDPNMRDLVLRHETLHAALHDRPRDVPYWVDEGIAQHFAPDARRWPSADPLGARLVDRRAEDDFARLVRDRT
jgi:tetratricopeptide (TPR) repeat protein